MKKYRHLAKCYARLIKAGKRKFKDVPGAFKAEVREILEEAGLGHLAE